MTEMASSKLLQVKVKHLFFECAVKEVVTKIGDHNRYTFEDLAEVAGAHC